MSSYPSLMWEVDNNNQSIIHFAVLHRHANIFNIIHEIGSIKDLIVTKADPQDNNLLHCAAKLAPPDQLNLVSGAAFQLMLELLWFHVRIFTQLHGCIQLMFISIFSLVCTILIFE